MPDLGSLTPRKALIPNPSPTQGEGITVPGTESPSPERARGGWGVKGPRLLLGIILLFLITTLAGCGGSTPSQSTAIHKIKHVIIIMQENRSFDHYFGT
ncbi:MAG TPA: alkaline phosphatase family protein, partial [Chloroflexota bacterium]